MVLEEEEIRGCYAPYRGRWGLHVWIGFYNGSFWKLFPNLKRAYKMSHFRGQFKYKIHLLKWLIPKAPFGFKNNFQNDTF